MYTISVALQMFAFSAGSTRNPSDLGGHTDYHIKLSYLSLLQGSMLDYSESPIYFWKAEVSFLSGNF